MADFGFVALHADHGDREPFAVFICNGIGMNQKVKTQAGGVGLNEAGPGLINGVPGEAHGLHVVEEQIPVGVYVAGSITA